jgi:hypothetical protein
MNLYVKRLERGRFVWPQAQSAVGASECGAVVDAVRGHRLASSTALVAAGSCGVMTLWQGSIEDTCVYHCWVRTVWSVKFGPLF